MKNNRSIAKIIAVAAATAALAISAVAAISWKGFVPAGLDRAWTSAVSRGTWDITIFGARDGADLDVYVYDEDGDLLAYDDLLDNTPAVRVYIPYTQTVKIVVANEGEQGGNFTGVID